MKNGSEGIGLLPCLTCVMWMGCAIVSVAGLYGPTMQPVAPTTRPTDATPIEVSLLAEPSESAMLSPSLDSMPPPTLDSPAAEDSPPAPEAIAPGPAVAFAVPIDVQPSVSTSARPAPPVVDMQHHTAKPSHVIAGVRQLTFGSGEGRQPAPEYPADAALAGQQGSVGVVFSVNADGRVTQATVEYGSGWPALNHAAVDAIRDTWRFAPGAARAYRVTIQFRLAQQ